jgi:hypothetical protein
MDNYKLVNDQIDLTDILLIVSKHSLAWFNPLPDETPDELRRRIVAESGRAVHAATDDEILTAHGLQAMVLAPEEFHDALADCGVTLAAEGGRDG